MTPLRAGVLTVDTGCDCINQICSKVLKATTRGKRAPGGRQVLGEWQAARQTLKNVMNGTTRKLKRTNNL